MAWQSGGGNHRHEQGVGLSNSVQDDEEDPEDSPGMKRRRRAAIFDVLPVLQEVSLIQRRLSRKRRVKLAMLILLTTSLLASFRYYSRSGHGEQGRRTSKGAKVVKESNLNKLDMPTRMVAGVRRDCLQLLPEGELEKLQLPPARYSVVKEVRYLRDGRNFAGDPTPSQRLASFEVRDTMQVHCGWCSDNGFDIDAVDKAFMETCRVVVITCAFGGGDNLYQPIGLVNATASKVCYVAFWDDVTEQTQEEAGNRLGADRKIGLWRVVLVRNLPFG